MKEILIFILAMILVLSVASLLIITGEKDSFIILLFVSMILIFEVKTWIKEELK